MFLEVQSQPNSRDWRQSESWLNQPDIRVTIEMYNIAFSSASLTDVSTSARRIRPSSHDSYVVFYTT